MVDFLILMGWMRAAIPISRRILRMLLPMTLPRSMSVLPFMRAEMDTANSGAPVPKATIVRPTNCLLILQCAAIEEEPETSQSAPLMRRTKPIMSKMICSAISIMFMIIAQNMKWGWESINDLTTELRSHKKWCE